MVKISLPPFNTVGVATNIYKKKKWSQRIIAKYKISLTLLQNKTAQQRQINKK